MAIDPRLMQSMDAAKRRMEMGGMRPQRANPRTPLGAEGQGRMQATMGRPPMQRPQPGQRPVPPSTMNPSEGMEVPTPPMMNGGEGPRMPNPAPQQRPYNPQVGREMNRQIAEMRQIDDEGEVRDPRFTSYQANVIRRRVYGIQRQNFIDGQISANDMANTENYLNSVSDEEVVQNYPMFFDMERDGAGYVSMVQAEEANRRRQMAMAEYYGRMQGKQGFGGEMPDGNAGQY